MAAYAALISLMNTMEDIKNHPRLSTSLDKFEVERLSEKVGFFVDFMESYASHGGNKGVEDLESQIASAAHEAEDVIESYIADQVLSRFNQERSINLSHLSCLFNLQKVVLDMDSTMEKVMKVKEKSGFKDQQPIRWECATSSRSLTHGKTTMVGFDSYSTQLLDLLTGQQSGRQIISIVGMGGIGKTTLAKNAYEDSIVVWHFDARAWITVSQNYDVKRIFVEAFSHLGEHVRGDKTEYELGDQLYKILFGRRYLIVLDDMWSTEAWDKVQHFFPNKGESSRVILTTRLSNVALYCDPSPIRVDFLDEDNSWTLFCETIFGYPNCPHQLEKIGKEIAKLCKGLPLSIVVTGGLLRKSHWTVEFWKKVSGDISSILHSEQNEQCLNVLSLSYNHLPVHLKPCFIYMGIFLEDEDIRVSRLIRLWVAEGFIKPNDGQILEDIAEGYLKDLHDRNLILVSKRHRNGKIKTYRIHDLLRGLCLRIAEKVEFFCAARMHSIPQVIDRARRLVFLDFPSSFYNDQAHHALQSKSHVRSLICKGVDLSIKPRLLRVLDRASHCSLDAEFHNVNLRYFAYQPQRASVESMLSSSVSLVWNLQTLIIRGRGPSEKIVAPSEIWKMPQLRHIECDEIYFPDPPQSDKQDDLFVLEKLQTLQRVVNFTLSDEVYTRIPNVKKLYIIYDDTWKGYDDSLCDTLCNLDRLHKLESLSICFIDRDTSYSNFTFPRSLNKLFLAYCRLHWEDLTMVCSLPQLEILELGEDSVVGCEWSTLKDGFRRLKFLRIYECELRSWIAGRSCFPVLEKLDLGGLDDLQGIPPGIGEIPTLQLIHLDYCSVSAVISAMKIKKEQEILEDHGLQIEVTMFDSDIESLKEEVEKEDGLSIGKIDKLVFFPLMALKRDLEGLA